MHTSFEDLRPQNWEKVSDLDGSILIQNEEGNWIWERPRTRREAGYRRSVALTLAIGIGMGVPLAIALVFMFG